MTTTSHSAPASAPNLADFLEDAKGRLIPRRLVKEIDLERDELVRELVGKAIALHELLATFKRSTMDDIAAFLELSAERYGAKLAGEKGNVTLTSFDGRLKIIRATADQLVFDERLQIAKGLIDECIHEWIEGSRDEIRALVDQAFQVDKQGKVSAERVLGLRKLEIEHPKWRSAMQAISDSVQVASTRSYVRFYVRDDAGDYQPVNLDIAAL